MIEHSTLRMDGREFLTVLVKGHGLLQTDDSNPLWNEIQDALDKVEVAKTFNDQDALTALTQMLPDLFDRAVAVANRFQPLSDRVSVKAGRVYFDGDEVDNSVTKLIVRCLNADEDFTPLVAFMENIAANQNEHSREQLFDWLNARDFTITPEGNIVGYKGCMNGGEFDGEPCYQSTSTGKATVNGEVFTGYIPNPIGAVVEMPRSEVAHNPHAACSTGLHVGTKDYAQSYAYNGALLEVHVNPRDVVSVPHEGHGEKVRVCRYKVVGEISEEIVEPIKYDLEKQGHQIVQQDRDTTAYRNDEPVDPTQQPPEGQQFLTSSTAVVAPVSPTEGDEVVASNDGAEHPSADEFNTMIGRAKRRRRNFVKYATKHGGWQFIGEGDPLDRRNWVV